MSRPLFTNNAASALAQAITPTDTILKLTPGTGSYFPQPTIGDYFMLTLVQINNPEVSEIVECIDRVGDTLTVVRGQEGTQPQIFNLSDNVELRITAGSLNLFAIGGGGGGSASGTSVADYTATQGQTVFTLPWSYTQGIDNLAIFINGSKQVVNVNYTESTTTSFTMASGLNAGDIVQAIYNLPLAGGIIDASNVIYNEGSTGAINSTVKTKLQESVSVKDFGAIGNGIADDTAAIQAAISAVSLGGTVFVPTGTYVVSSTLNVSNINFVGNGYSTVIKPTSAVTTVISLNGTAYAAIAGVTWRSTVSDIFIDGSSTTNATGILIGTTPTSGNYLISNVAVNLFAGGSGKGIQLAEAIWTRVENCAITRCDIGTYVFAPVAPTNPTTASFENCHWVSNNVQGVLLKSGYQVTFRNCIFEGNKGEGFKGYPAAGIPSLLLSLEDCWFEDNQQGQSGRTSLYSCIMDGTLADTFSFQMTNVEFSINNVSEKAISINKVYSSSIKEIETNNIANAVAVQNIVNNGLVFVSYPTNYDFISTVNNVDNSQIVYLPESYTGTGASFSPTITGTGGMVFTPTNFINNSYVTVQKNTTYRNSTKQCTVHLYFQGTTSVTPSASFDVSLPAGIVAANSTEYTTAIVLDNNVQSIGLIKTKGASGLTVAKLNSTAFSLNPNCGVQCTFTFDIL